MRFDYRNNELKKYLEQKHVFKLICGANNENYDEITRLVEIYSKAGVRFFDINASSNAIQACKTALNGMDCFICVSVGTKNDPHLTKCKINSNCVLCKKCESVCPQNAVLNGKIIEKNCIGCKKCVAMCEYNAIEAYQKELQFDKILDEVKEADCIEFHIITDNKDEIFEKWRYIIDNYGGYLSIALNKSLFSEKEMYEILSKMVNMAKNRPLMIQADGKSMSGGVDDYNSTLQAVATADTILKFGFDIPVIISGGTNSKSFELAEHCSVDITGVAMGSYARRIVKDYINQPSNAVKIAKELVLSCFGAHV